MTHPPAINTDDIGADIVGKTIETTLANGANVRDRVVAMHVEIPLTATGRAGAARRYLLLENIRPTRTSLEILAAGDYADWITLHPNSALYIYPDTEVA